MTVLHVILVCSLFSLSAFTLNAQEPEFEKGISIRPYMGILALDRQTFSIASVTDREQQFVGLPATFGLATTFKQIGNKSFTFDVNYSYTGFKWRKDINAYEFDENGDLEYVVFEDWKAVTNKFRVMLGVNQIIKSNDKYITYASLSLGYKYKNYVRIIDGERNANIQKTYDSNGVTKYLSRIAARIAWGKKWMLSEKCRFNLEIGIGAGSNPLQFGLEFRL